MLGQSLDSRTLAQYFTKLDRQFQFSNGNWGIAEPHPKVIRANCQPRSINLGRQCDSFDANGILRCCTTPATGKGVISCT